MADTDAGWLTQQRRLSEDHLPALHKVQLRRQQGLGGASPIPPARSLGGKRGVEEEGGQTRGHSGKPSMPGTASAWSACKEHKDVAQKHGCGEAAPWMVRYGVWSLPAHSSKMLKQQLGLERMVQHRLMKAWRWKSQQAGQQSCQQDSNVGWHGHSSQPGQQKASVWLRCAASACSSAPFQVEGDVR